MTSSSARTESIGPGTGGASQPIPQVNTGGDMGRRTGMLGEVPSTAKLSGQAYVSVLPLDEVEPKFRPGVDRVVIALNPEQCVHGIRVCHAFKECLESWQWDYTFRFERTAGGRALLERAGVQADRRIATLIAGTADVETEQWIALDDVLVKAEPQECYRMPAWAIVDRLMTSLPIEGFGYEFRNGKWMVKKVSHA